MKHRQYYPSDFYNLFEHRVMDDNEEFARDFEHCEEMLSEFRYKLWSLIIDDVVWKIVVTKYFMYN